MILAAFKHAWLTFKAYSLRKKIALISIVVLLALLFISLFTYAWFARDITDQERLMNRNNTGIRLMDSSGESFYTLGRVKEDNDLKLAEISDNLEQALIASEDKNFYEHSGYSIRGIGGAAIANVLNRDATAYGGSTLTQQLVKNNLLSSSKSFLRKYQELSIAIAVERNYTKDQILEMYINSVYYGEGAFGIEQAAKTYFNKSPQQLTLAESSMLIGILPAPSSYSPISGDVEKAKRQQKRVLNSMAENGYITRDEADEAFEQELAYGSGLDATNKHAQHFSQMVLSELNKRYGEERVARSGFQVTTSLDLNWQKAAEEQVQNRVRQLGAQGGRNSSVVAIDPRSGAIRALVGSADWNNEVFGKVNMATTARQPGSSFKPVYFAEAIDKRVITAATILKDQPKTFGTYKPENYDFKYMGDVTARRALAQSRNLTAIEVMEKLGISQSIAGAQRVGIKSVNGTPEQYGLALALGTAETTLLEMTNAYAAYANAGRQFEPTLIMSIEDKFGSKIFEYQADKAKQVISPEASYIISSMLSDTQARAPTFNSLNISGRSVAVKTGTTNDNHDAWTIGYTPSIAVGVWLGNNENEAMSGVAGASGAGPVWRGTMQRILQGTTAETFTAPSSVQRLQVCSANGKRATAAGEGTYAEFFISGSAPRETCTPGPSEEEKKKLEEERLKEEEKKKEEERKRLEEQEDDTDEEITTTTPVVKPACSDGLDNDGDGLIDYPQDPGCTSIDDDDEINPTTTTPPPTRTNRVETP